MRPTTFGGFAISTRGELGGAREERVGADLQPRGEDAAEVLALGGHAVEVRRRAEVDDDDAALGPVEAGDRVGDAVGADLARVLDRGWPCPVRMPGADDERLAPEGAAARGCIIGSVSDGTTLATIAASTLFAVDAVHGEERAQSDRVLVGGAAARALDAELVDEPFAVEEAVDDVRVADVDGEEHGGAAGSLRRIAAPAHSSTRTARMTSPSATALQSPSARPTHAYWPSRCGSRARVTKSWLEPVSRPARATPTSRGSKGTGDVSQRRSAPEPP